MHKESERREEIDDRVESLRPSGWHLAHISTSVAKILAGPTLARDFEELLGVIESIHVIPELGEEMRVPALSARHIQNTRSNWEREELAEARDFLSIALGGKKKAVLPEIVGVECRLPPLFRLLQKKTGSR
jgi:hypothetical protein